LENSICRSDLLLLANLYRTDVFACALGYESTGTPICLSGILKMRFKLDDQQSTHCSRIKLMSLTLCANSRVNCLRTSSGALKKHE
jgi:hypothetical protein